MSTSTDLSPALAELLSGLLTGKQVSARGPDIWVEQGNLALALEDIGEGRDGEYDPDDPDDVPLLRYTLHGRQAEMVPWQELDGGSYCTQLDAREPWEIRLACACDAFLRVVMEASSDPKTWLKGDMVGAWPAVSSGFLERMSYMDGRGRKLDAIRAQLESEALDQATAAASAVARSPRL